MILISSAETPMDRPRESGKEDVMRCARSHPDTRAWT